MGDIEGGEGGGGIRNIGERDGRRTTTQEHCSAREGCLQSKGGGTL